MHTRSGGLQGGPLPPLHRPERQNQGDPSAKRHFTRASADVTVWTHLDPNSKDPYLKMTFEPRGVCMRQTPGDQGTAKNLPDVTTVWLVIGVGARREPPPLQCVFKEIPEPSWVLVLNHGAQVHPFQSKRWQVPGGRGEVDPPGSAPPFSRLTPHRPGEAPGPSSNRELCPVEAGVPGEGSVHTTPHKPRPHPGPALIPAPLRRPRSVHWLRGDQLHLLVEVTGGTDTQQAGMEDPPGLESCPGTPGTASVAAALTSPPLLLLLPSRAHWSPQSPRPSREAGHIRWQQGLSLPEHKRHAVFYLLFILQIFIQSLLSARTLFEGFSNVNPLNRRPGPGSPCKPCQAPRVRLPEEASSLVGPLPRAPSHFYHCCNSHLSPCI